MHTFGNGKANELAYQDRAVHDWYRFVLSFPPHLVRQYLNEFGAATQQRVLDPFCGTGTTLVECKKLGIASVGIEANPMTYFASQVKTNWSIDLSALKEQTTYVGQVVRAMLEADGINDDANLQPVAERDLMTLPDKTWDVMLKDSISPLPLHKTLILLNQMQNHFDSALLPLGKLALAHALTTSISNLKYSPEVGIGRIKTDAPVLTPWLENIRRMAEDLSSLRDRDWSAADLYAGDARQVDEYLEPASISAVITSPPYPNEKDYTRMTRIESVLLGFISDREDLRRFKQGLMRSNTRNVYVNDDDDQWSENYPVIQELANRIEQRRIALGKTSGFERLYAKTTRLYFGGMAKHLTRLRSVLQPGAHLAYVVGDQASYLRVMIHTGQILAEIAQSLGYELVRIDLFRTRLATATREQLREEVVVLRWKG